MTELLFILSHPPGASVYAQEAFDAALAGSAFSNIAILFVGAGCLQLIQPKLAVEAHQRKDFRRGFKALADYDVHDVYGCEDSFKQFGLHNQALVIQPTLLTRVDISACLKGAQRVLCF